LRCSPSQSLSARGCCYPAGPVRRGGRLHPADRLLLPSCWRSWVPDDHRDTWLLRGGYRASKHPGALSAGGLSIPGSSRSSYGPIPLAGRSWLLGGVAWVGGATILDPAKPLPSKGRAADGLARWCRSTGKWAVFIYPDPERSASVKTIFGHFQPACRLHFDLTSASVDERVSFIPQLGSMIYHHGMACRNGKLKPGRRRQPGTLCLACPSPTSAATGSSNHALRCRPRWPADRFKRVG